VKKKIYKKIFQVFEGSVCVQCSDKTEIITVDVGGKE